MQGRFILAADIGGTNSRFALFKLEESEQDFKLVLVENSRLRLPTQKYSSFTELLLQLETVSTPGGYTCLPTAGQKNFEIVAVSMGGPGPVANGICRPPNISWPLVEAELSAVVKRPATLINDFFAQGQACLFPEILGLMTVLGGQAAKDYPAIILGAGTGLGKAIVLPGKIIESATWTESNVEAKGSAANTVIISKKNFIGKSLPHWMLRQQKRILPSEGGHASFPFNGGTEEEFADFARRVSGQTEIIGDMVITGHGLSLIYAYCNGTTELLPPPAITPQLDKCPDALALLARFYGRACRNMALELMSLGGVYLSGGILSHVPGLIGHPEFEAEFRRSHEQAYLLQNIPVWWVRNQDAGLWGAALHGLTLIG